jgi:hypothetical protein
MMIIVCNRCGNYEPDDSQFCGKCRAFLEFDGTVVEGQWVDGKLAKAAVPAQRLDGAPGVPQPDSATAAQQAHAATAAQQAHAATAAQQADAATRAQQPDAATAAQQPGETRQVYQPRVEPVRAPVDGEIRCPQCGRGNDPTRVYCRFDGVLLRAAAPPPEVRLPWWKRLWRRLFGRSRQPARDGRKRAPRRRVSLPMRWISLAVIAVLAVVFNAQLRTFASRAETEIKDRVSRHQPITPSKVTASSSRGGNGPERLADRANDKFWAPQGQPVGSWVEFNLPKPVRLLDLIVTGGQHGESSVEFQKQGRPDRVEAVLTSQDGKTVTTRLVMEDRNGPQSFQAKGDRIVKVKLTFLSAHGMQPGRFMAVAEVEFFYRD